MTVPNLTAPELPEAFALGAALLSPNALKVVRATGLTPHDMHDPDHRTIYDAMIRLDDTGRPVDAITVADELNRTGLLDQAGGMGYLLDLQVATPAISLAELWALTVVDAARGERGGVGFASLTDAPRRGGASGSVGRRWVPVPGPVPDHRVVAAAPGRARGQMPVRDADRGAGRGPPRRRSGPAPLTMPARGVVTVLSDEDAFLLVTLLDALLQPLPAVVQAQRVAPARHVVSVLNVAAHAYRAAVADAELQARLVPIGEASRLTGTPERTLRAQAAAGAVYGEKRGSRWLVDPTALPMSRQPGNPTAGDTSCFDG